MKLKSVTIPDYYFVSKASISKVLLDEIVVNGEEPYLGFHKSPATVSDCFSPETARCRRLFRSFSLYEDIVACLRLLGSSIRVYHHRYNIRANLYSAGYVCSPYLPADANTAA